MALQAFGSSMSVLFLALISLERVYSVLWPFRHRVTSTRTYVYSIVIVWVIGLCMSGLWLVRIYQSAKLYCSATYSSTLFIALLIIFASYLKIRTRLRSRAPDHDLDVGKQASTEKTLRMSRTFFIVIAVSLVFWLPAFVMFLIKEFCSCFSPLAVWLVVVLQSVNSMVNPFVYSFRMPSFQDALKKCWRNRRQNIEIRDIPKTSHNMESKLWVMAWLRSSASGAGFELWLLSVMFPSWAKHYHRASAYLDKTVHPPIQSWLQVFDGLSYYPEGIGIFWVDSCHEGRNGSQADGPFNSNSDFIYPYFNFLWFSMFDCNLQRQEGVGEAELPLGNSKLVVSGVFTGLMCFY